MDIDKLLNRLRKPKDPEPVIKNTQDEPPIVKDSGGSFDDMGDEDGFFIGLDFDD